LYIWIITSTVILNVQSSKFEVKCVPPSVITINLYRTANVSHASKNNRVCPLAPCMVYVLYNLRGKCRKKNQNCHVLACWSKSKHCKGC